MKVKSKYEYLEALNNWYSIYLIDLEEKEIARESYFILKELIDNLEHKQDKVYQQDMISIEK